MKRLLRNVLTATLTIGLLSGCASSEAPKKDVPIEDAQGQASNKVTIVASNFQFDQAEYRVKKGDVLLKLENKEGMHGIIIPDLDVNIQGNASQKVSLNEPGTYDIMCSIPCGSGHAKMQAKLIVE